jgi:hypothetical protein
MDLRIKKAGQAVPMTASSVNMGEPCTLPGGPGKQPRLEMKDERCLSGRGSGICKGPEVRKYIWGAR